MPPPGEGVLGGWGGTGAGVCGAVLRARVETCRNQKQSPSAWFRPFPCMLREQQRAQIPGVGFALGSVC